MKKYVIKESYLPETRAFIKGVLKELNDPKASHAYLDQLSESYEVRERAKSTVNKEGISLTNSFTGAKRKNPLLRVIHEKDNLICRYVRMLKTDAAKHNKELAKEPEVKEPEYSDDFLYALDYGMEDLSIWERHFPGQPYPWELAKKLESEGLIAGYIDKSE